MDDDFGYEGFANISSDTNLDSLYTTKVVLQPDGKIVVAGTQNPEDGDGGDVALVRYNADGALDETFGTGDDQDDENGVIVQDMGYNNSDGADSVAIDSDGKILVAGSVAGDFAVARFNADGSGLDTTFSTDGIATINFGTETSAHGVAIQSDGKIITVGESNDGNDGDDDIALARFNADGSLDNTFGTGGKVVLSQIDDAFNSFEHESENGDDTAYSVALDNAGNIYVSGNFGYVGENAYQDTIEASFLAVAKYTTNGILDTTFGTNGIYISESVQQGYLLHEDSMSGENILVQPDGNIVIAGGNYYSAPWHWEAEVVNEFFAMRMDDTGTLDSQFGSAYNTVYFAETDDFVEGGDAVTIGADGYRLPTIYDVEQHALNNYNGGTLTIHRADGANIEDLIRFDTSVNSAMTLAGITLEGTSATTGNIKHGGSTFATFNTNATDNEASTDGQLVISFVAGSTQTLVDALTASISYDNTNDVNPAYDEGEVELSWLYNDGDEQETTSSCYISIEGDDDGGIEGTVTVSGTPTTGTILSITGLDTITDPDLVTDENEDGTVPEDGLSFQWQVSSDGGETWENIDGAYDSTFEVTETENSKEIRVVVGYEDPTNGSYTEIQSDTAGEGGEDNGGGGNSGGGDNGGGST
ncbi:MAG: hypothetical protein WC279_10720, partial [Sulfurimonas sp.]|uniref:hypothetical protein n=1 Tax=Sulfurimonas sp. TaxID=2022749 RepID=UPI0035669B78